MIKKTNIVQRLVNLSNICNLQVMKGKKIQNFSLYTQIIIHYNTVVGKKKLKIFPKKCFSK